MNIYAVTTILEWNHGIYALNGYIFLNPECRPITEQEFRMGGGRCPVTVVNILWDTNRWEHYSLILSLAPCFDTSRLSFLAK